MYDFPKLVKRHFTFYVHHPHPTIGVPNLRQCIFAIVLDSTDHSAHTLASPLCECKFVKMHVPYALYICKSIVYTYLDVFVDASLVPVEHVDGDSVALLLLVEESLQTVRLRLLATLDRRHFRRRLWKGEMVVVVVIITIIIVMFLL